MTHWETDPRELVRDLGMQVAYEFRRCIKGGGLLGKYQPKPVEVELEQMAIMFSDRQVTNLTLRRAEEIAAGNRQKQTL